jgi:bla regulator protein blaR1
MIAELHFPGTAIAAFALALFHSLWQFMLIAIAWRGLLFLAKRAPALTRYYISLVALAAMPAVFMVTFLRTALQQAPANSTRAAAMTSELQTVMQAGTADLPVRFLETLTLYSPLIFWSYIAILFALTIKFVTGWSRMAQLRKQETRALPPEMTGLIMVIAQRAGLNRMVPVYQSARVNVPLVTGLFKPVVLLPLAMLSSLDVRQVETIILHEFRHIAFKDHYINILLNLVEIIFFYHPAAWWICREIRLEREIRIDEWIVKTTGDPVVYARALINLEIDRESPGIVIAVGGSGNHLFYRIKNIINMKTQGPKHLRYPGSLLILLVAVLSAAWFNPVFTSGESFATDSEKTIRLNDYPDTSISPEGSTSPFAQSEDRLAGPAEGDRVIAERQEKQGERSDSEKLLEELRQLQEELRAMLGSEEFRQQKRQAQEGSRKAFEQMNEEFDQEEFRSQMKKFQEEMREHFDSQEFREQMRQAGEEARKAVEQMKAGFDSEEFGRQMRQFQNEMNEQFNSEEFRERMRQAGEEARKAIEKMKEGFDSEEFHREMRQFQNEMREQFDSQEFREQMRQIQKEIREQINSQEFQEQMRQIREEARKALEQRGKFQEQ